MTVRVVATGLLSALLLALPAAGQQVKISQVYGGGGNTGAPFNRDFVELFNAGGVAIDITGWSVQYASATGTTWSKTDLPSASIPAGGYFLIQMTLSGTVGAPLPTPDHIVASAISMSATAGKVALCNSTTALSGSCPADASIIDFVGFGTANCFEGTGATGAPSNTTAVLRNNNGCDDTNNNSADFTVAAPNPRNSASPLNPCPLPPGSDLSITMAASAPQINIGANVSFNATASNFGPDPATGVSIVLTIPANTTFVSSTPPETPAGGMVTFAIGDLAVLGTTMVSVELTADSGATVAPTITVDGNEDDPDLGNNTASAVSLIYDRTRAAVVMGVDDAGFDVYAADTQSGATEVLFQGEVAGLASDDANRRFYFTTGTQLFWAPYDAPRTPVLVGNFNGAVTGLSGGLAWDSTRGTLYGTTTSSIYEIDTSTARTTLVRAVGAGDFGGIDYDPLIDRLIATNDSTSTTPPVSGRGLYILDPLGSEATLVAGYPIRTGTTLETDIDGCAAGGGYIYPVTDETMWLHRYNRTSMSYEAPFATPFGGDRGSSGATYTTELFSQSPGANIAVTFAVPAACTVIAGGNLTYTLTVRNHGPDTATAVVLTNALPSGTTFISSVPPLTPVGSDLVLSAGDLADEGVATLEVTVQTMAAGITSTSATLAATSTDPFPINNSASASIQIAEPPPATAEAVGIFSTLPGSNEVPGNPGLFFSDVVDLGRIFRSSSGNYWVIAADTDAVDVTSDRVMLRGQGATFEVVAREGVTTVGGLPIGTFDAVMGVNNNGDFAFGAPLSTADMIAKSVGGGLTLVALEAQAVPSIPGATYGTTSNAATIQNDGTVSFYSNLVGPPTTSDTAVFTDDGNTLVAQEGVTIPGNQNGGLMDTYRVIDTGATLGQGFFMAGDGVRYSLRGAIGPADTDDLVNVIDGNVAIQEGTLLPGFASLVSAINMNNMETDGTWFAYGSNADTIDWVVRNGTVIATTDAPIFSGATELFDDAQFAQTFFFAIGNPAGDYIVGGLTNAETIANAVMVLNNRRVVLRENDPIDLDNDGSFDDNAYIHIFRDDFAILDNNGWLTLAVRLRSGAGICSGSPTETGQALIRIQVFCPADYNRDDVANSQDYFDFLTDFFSNDADFNADGVTNSQDYFDFLTAFFTPCD
jgi:uncharacterized repeat protein (TIGR01451 family)